MLRSAREVIILLCALVFMLCNFFLLAKNVCVGGDSLNWIRCCDIFFNNNSKVFINVVVTLVGDVVPWWTSGGCSMACSSWPSLWVYRGWPSFASMGYQERFWEATSYYWSSPSWGNSPWTIWIVFGGKFNHKKNSFNTFQYQKFILPFIDIIFWVLLPCLVHSKISWFPIRGQNIITYGKRK